MTNYVSGIFLDTAIFIHFRNFFFIELCQAFTLVCLISHVLQYGCYFTCHEMNLLSYQCLLVIPSCCLIKAIKWGKWGKREMVGNSVFQHFFNNIVGWNLFGIKNLWILFNEFHDFIIFNEYQTKNNVLEGVISFLKKKCVIRNLLGEHIG